MAPTADLPVPSYQGFYSSTHPSETFLPSQTRHIHDSQGAKDSLKTKPGFTHKNLETKRKTTNSKIQRYSRFLWQCQDAQWPIQKAACLYHRQTFYPAGVQTMQSSQQLCSIVVPIHCSLFLGVLKCLS